MKLLSRDQLPEKGLPASNSTLWIWRKTLGFPAPIKIGRHNYWVEEEVDQWLQRQLSKRPCRDVHCGAADETPELDNERDRG
jgi:predicted DNA-binding transcriptional regulator AlpA